MEIKSITVDANYCFGNQPLILSDLKQVNFIFAPNGAGKSTISNRLAQQPTKPVDRASWKVAPTDLPIRVFNEAYRSRVLTEHLNGIFTIGDNSKAISEKIVSLEDKNRDYLRECIDWKTEIGSASDENNMTGLQGDIEHIRVETSISIFEAHKVVDSSIRHIVFEGFRSSKKKFLSEARRRFDKSKPVQSTVNWEPLMTRAQSLSGDKKSRQLLPEITITKLVSDTDIAAVEGESSYVGKGTFAQLIRHLGNEDWVNHGREFLDRAQGKCPFCQNEAPTDLVQELSRYFARGFDAALQRANRIKNAAKEKADKLHREISTLETVIKKEAEIDEEAFASLILSVRTAKELLLSMLHQKTEHPTKPVEISDIDSFANELLYRIKIENEKIKKHNQLVENAETERDKLIEEGWEIFLSQRLVNNAMQKLVGIESSKKARIRKIRKCISKNHEVVYNNKNEIARLRQTISNPVEVAERINKLLAAMGFHRFQLVIAHDATESYRIAREDGTPAYTSLSEGEKTFICFAYYWESLFGTTAANEIPNDVVAVIDDPVSSLDSEALFMIASYIRDAAKLTIDGSTNLRQLIILTHNTQFHHEAAYTPGGNSKGRRYFRLMKELDGFTTVRDDGNDSKIRGSYALLWSSVVEVARIDDESALIPIGIFNIVRRILEGYFKSIGNLQNSSQLGSVSSSEERLISHFLIWANSGSHTITDDIDQTMDVGRTKDFLKLFKQYFDIQGHGAHFDMMITASGGKDLLESGQLFARL